MFAVATLHVAFPVTVDWDDSRHFLHTARNPCYAGWDAAACQAAGAVSVDEICGGQWERDLNVEAREGRSLSLADRAGMYVRHVTIDAIDIADPTAPVWLVLHESSDRDKRGHLHNDQHTVVAAATGSQAAAIVEFRAAFERFALLREAMTPAARSELVSYISALCADPVTGSFTGAVRDER